MARNPQQQGYSVLAFRTKQLARIEDMLKNTYTGETSKTSGGRNRQDYSVEELPSCNPGSREINLRLSLSSQAIPVQSFRVNPVTLQKSVIFSRVSL